MTLALAGNARGGDLYSWTKATVDFRGEVVGGVGDDVVALFDPARVKALSTAGGHVQAETWVRFEFQEPQDGPRGWAFRSQLIRVVFDCDGEMYQMRALFHYEHNNAIGDARSTNEPPPGWEYIPPRSLIAMISYRVCGVARDGAVPADFGF